MSDRVDHGHKCILLVEDEALIAMEEAAALTAMGYLVANAYTGAEAVEKACSVAGGIDLVLMDINLGPGMDGIEAAREILKIRDIPVVFLSSHTEKEIAERVGKVTSYGYIIKNTGMTVLAASIGVAFRLHEAHRALKEKEALISESEKNYRAMFENTGTAMVIFNENAIIIHANAQFESLSGYPRQEIEGKMRWSDFVSREDLDSMLERHRQRGEKSDGVPRQYEFRFVSRSGDTRHILLTIDMIPGTGNRVASLMDITERKRAEETVRESEERYRRIFENSILGIFQTTPDGKFISINQALAAMLQYESPDDLISSVQNDVSNLYAVPAHREQFLGLITGKGSVHGFEDEFRRKDGSTAMGCLYAWPVVDAGGAVQRIEGFVDDITDQKQAERTLNETLQQLHDIIEFLPDPAFVIDRDRKVIYWNKSMEQLSGAKKEEMLGQGDYAYAVPFFRKRRPMLIDLVDFPTAELEAKYDYVRRLDSNVYAEVFIPHMNRGEGAYLWGSAAPLFDTAGRRIGAIEVIRDITERKLAEQALRESELKYRHLFNYAPTGIYEVDFTRGRFVRVNSIICEYTGYTEEELLTMNTLDILTDESRELFIDRLRKFSAGESVPASPEYCIREKDGKTRWIELHNEFIRKDGKITGATVVAHDITERRLAQEKIQNLLAEKELLLKEVHHRIKNNMNTIMSLLSLQSNATKEPAAAAALQDAVRRMQSMAMLYDKLYRSENLREMPVRSYLTSLIDEIMAMFPVNTAVRVEKEIADIVLGANTLSPLGMIINELLSNAMKYAFTGRAEGVIAVSVLGQGDRGTLVVRDNGVGIPVSVDLEKSGGFGYTLVRVLVKQLRGSIDIERDRGTVVRIGFSI